MRMTKHTKIQNNAYNQIWNIPRDKISDVTLPIHKQLLIELGDIKYNRIKEKIFHTVSIPMWTISRAVIMATRSA